MECVRRRTYYDLHGKEKRLHLLQGLAAILLDIDKAIHIIRTTEEETEVVPNLMIGFGIDEVQADYVAEIKLRHLNREYILKRTSEIEQLEKDIADLNDVLAKPARIRRIIINELNEVAKKYGQPRRSEILYDLPEEENGAEEETVPDYPVTVFFTREGYLKKIPPQSLRTAGAHKLKEGDEIIQQVETRNNMESLWKSMHATGFPVSRLSVAPKHVESNSHSVQTMSMPTSDDWNTAPKPSSNVASQPTIYGSRR